MAKIVAATENYRKDFIGSKAQFDAYYGENQMNRPAYVKTGRIIDTGITVKSVGGEPYYRFDCRTALHMYNCQDRVMGTKSFGWSRGGRYINIVRIKYNKACTHVRGANPAPKSIIDIRTIDQLKAGCCPKALESLFLNSGAG